MTVEVRLQEMTVNETRLYVCVCPALINLDSLSNMRTSFMASYSFCSSVIPSIGLGCSSCTTPVIGFILERGKRQERNIKRHRKKKAKIYVFQKKNEQLSLQGVEVSLRPLNTDYKTVKGLNCRGSFCSCGVER